MHSKLNVQNSTPANRSLGGWLNWLYPPRCRFCREATPSAEDCFCAACLGKIRVIDSPVCTICGRPFLDTSGDDHLCGGCIGRSPHFARARSWACYSTDTGDEHPLRSVLQRYKYGRKVSLGKPLGRLMAENCRGMFSVGAFDLIVPVPLHKKRLRWRGFNQSVVLAHEVGKEWGIAVDAFALTRARETPPQTQLHEDERRKNMRRAFAVSPRRSVKEKAILLIDDVYTSGATVDECSRVLLRGGARDVSVLTLARTV